MAEKDYTKDSKKWPPTPGKPGWQIGKKKNNKNKDVQNSFKKGYG